MTTRTNYKKNRTFDFKLIDLVNGYPIIYKKQNGINHYEALKLKNIIWQKIADELRTTKSICIKRWINLRGQYTKELRLSRELCPINGVLRGSHWPYLERLSFLEESLQSNKTEKKISSPPTAASIKSETDLEVDNDVDEQILINCGKLPENVITHDLLEKLKNEGYVLVEEMDDQNTELFDYIPHSETKQQGPKAALRDNIMQQQSIATEYTKVLQQKPVAIANSKVMLRQQIVTPQVEVPQQQAISKSHIKFIKQEPIAISHSKLMQQEDTETAFSLENALIKISTQLKDFDEASRSVVEERILDFLRKVSLDATASKNINNLEI